MTDRITIDETDEGKRVVDPAGDEVGIVSGVRDGRAFVDPDPGITDTIKAKLGWDEVDEGDYPLPEASIARVSDDAVHLSERDG